METLELGDGTPPPLRISIVAIILSLDSGDQCEYIVSVLESVFLNQSLQTLQALPLLMLMHICASLFGPWQGWPARGNRRPLRD